MLGALTYSLWLTALGRYLVRADEPVRADIAVVLGGDTRGNRVLKAAELVRQGYVSQVLVSGPRDCCYGFHEHELAIPFAVRHGFPQSYFIGLPNEAHSTVEEAKIVIAELRRRKLHTVDLVTSNYHTHRAGCIYHALAPDLDIHLVAAPDPNFSPDRWWKQREGQKEFFKEWAKTVAYWLGI